MINIEKNIKFKNKINKKVLIFDLDGVLVDSKINMKKAWAAVQKKFNFQEKKFRDYFSKIGQLFNIILCQFSFKYFYTYRFNFIINDEQKNYY